MEFEKFPSIPRLYRDMVITEKIDGTNACAVFDESARLWCQSRNRIITPDDDNYGFARWAYDNASALFDTLGPGRHYGEWWGQGIQRGYGLTEKRFSLFNVHRWTGIFNNEEAAGWPKGLSVVPTLYLGTFELEEVEFTKNMLRNNGSYAAPGFMNPEGVVVYHTAAKQLFKSTFDDFDRSGGKTWQ